MLFHIKIDATEKNGVFKYSYQALLGGFLRCSRTNLIPFFAISATSSYRTFFFSRFYAETMQHIPQKRPPGRYIQTLALATTWPLYPDPCFSGRAGFSDLDPSDGGWSQNPMVTVLAYTRTLHKTALN